MAQSDMQTTIALVDKIVAIPKSVAHQRTPSEEVDLTIQMVSACVEAGATSAQDVISVLTTLKPLIKRIADPVGS